MRMGNGGSPSTNDKFLYVYSCDINQTVDIKISQLEGIFRDGTDPTRSPGPMTVEVSVYCNGRKVGASLSTSFATSLNSRNCIQGWNEWLKLPIKYSELSKDAFVHFTMWDEVQQLNLPQQFSNTMKAERKKGPDCNYIVLEDFEDEWNDWYLAGMNDGLPSSSSCVFPRRLIAECSFRLFCPKGLFRTGVLDLQMDMVDRPNPRRPPCEPWNFGGEKDQSDRLIREYERNKNGLSKDSIWLTQFTAVTLEKKKDERKRSQRCLFLVIQLPEAMKDSLKYEIVHYERAVALTVRKFIGGEGDNELGMDNPCEAKHNFMARITRPGAVDKQLRPSTAQRRKLEAAIELPPSQPLSIEQKDLIWKFRYFISSNDRALTKFLQSVDFNKPQEVDEALKLLEEWKPIRAEDALELLSSQFNHPKVRAYAVFRLHSASPDRLQLFLPQLVQALKYEPMNVPVEIEPVGVETSEPQDSPDIVEVKEAKKMASDDLSSFLVQYSTSYLNFANSLFWHLKVEEEATMGNGQTHTMYVNLRRRLLSALESSSLSEVKQRATSLIQQEQLVSHLKKVTQTAKASASSRGQKEVALKVALGKDQFLRKLDGLPLPVDPNFKLECVVGDRAAFFNSAMMPTRLTFSNKEGASLTEAANHYTVIFKEGDDMRQDQLVMQMIRLMDSLLKDSQLDLKLTPYGVLATGTDEGFVQFIKAIPLRDVIQKHGSIHNAMSSFRPSSTGPFGIEAEVIDNYVRSLAGYSIVCYILGVGDRHLDNLLLCENGRLFHVDFGYMLGRDPKPLPPPMKLTSEMIYAMGGVGSEHWKKFVAFCDEAFRVLRRHANLILNLFNLMLDAGIPDIAMERDKAVSKVEHRLQLQLSDDERYAFVTKLIETSVSAKMPVLVDFMHDLKQNFF